MATSEQYRTVEGWLRDLSAVLKVDLTLDPEGICTFQVDKDVVVLEVVPKLSQVQLFSPLAVLTNERKENVQNLMIKALELNAFQITTRGGTIALIPGKGVLVFCFNVPLEGTDAEIFNRSLGQFIETVDELKLLLPQLALA